MKLEYRYLSENIKNKLKKELPRGGQKGYLNFHIEDEWVTSQDETILLTKISNYHDIEGGPFLDVFTFVYNNNKYVLRTFSIYDETDNTRIRNVITICGTEINDEEKKSCFKKLRKYYFL